PLGRGVRALVQLRVPRTFEGSPADGVRPGREAALVPHVGPGFAGALLLMVWLAAAAPGFSPSGFAGAAEPPTSFAHVAATARAASIVIRAPDAEEISRSVALGSDHDEGQREGPPVIAADPMTREAVGGRGSSGDAPPLILSLRDDSTATPRRRALPREP